MHHVRHGNRKDLHPDPIEGVTLKRYGESNATATTDEEGEFEFEEVQGLSECQKMQVEVSAPGYTTMDIEIMNLRWSF